MLKEAPELVLVTNSDSWEGQSFCVGDIHIDRLGVAKAVSQPCHKEIEEQADGCQYKDYPDESEMIKIYCKTNIDIDILLDLSAIMLFP